MAKVFEFEGQRYHFQDYVPDDVALEKIKELSQPASWADTAGQILPETRRQLVETVAGTKGALGDVFKIPSWVEEAQRVRSEVTSERNIQTPLNLSMGQEALISGGASALTQLPSLAASAVGAPFLAARVGLKEAAKALASSTTTLMGAQTGLQKYGESRDYGFSPTRSAVHGLIHGLVEKYTEYLPVRDLLSGPFVGKTIVNYLGKEIAGEEVATLLQDLNDKVSTKPDMTFGDYLHDAGVTALSVGIAAPVQSVALKAIQTAAIPFVKEEKLTPEQKAAILTAQTQQQAALTGQVDPTLAAQTQEAQIGAVLDQQQKPPVDVQNLLLPDNVPAKTDGLVRLYRTVPGGEAQVDDHGVWTSSEDKLQQALNVLGPDASVFYVDIPKETLDEIQKLEPAQEIAQSGQVEQGVDFVVPKELASSAKVLYKPTAPAPAPVPAPEVSTPVPTPEATSAATPEGVVAPTPEVVPVATTPASTKATIPAKVLHTSEVKKGRVSITFSSPGLRALYLFGKKLVGGPTLGDLKETRTYQAAAGEATGLTDHALATAARNYYLRVSRMADSESTGKAFSAPEHTLEQETQTDEQKAKEELFDSIASEAVQGKVVISSTLKPTAQVRRMVAFLQQWMRLFTPNGKIVVLASTNNNAVAAITRHKGVSFIFVPQTPVRAATNERRLLDIFSVAHEFGHHIAFDVLEQPEYEEANSTLRLEWYALKERVGEMTALEFAEVWFAPHRVMSAKEFIAGEGVALDAPAQALIDAIDARRFPGYVLSFDEYLAEQFARYVGANTSLTVDQNEETQKYFKEALGKLKGFFDKIVSKLNPQTNFRAFIDGLRDSPPGPAISVKKAESLMFDLADKEYGFSLKVLNRLPKKAMWTKAQVAQELARGDVKLQEVTVIKRVLDTVENNTFSSTMFKQMVLDQIVPLSVRGTKQWADFGLSKIDPNLKSFAKVILFTLPFELSNENHWNDRGYFAHARVTETFEGNKVILNVVEIQSDLMQGSLPKYSLEEAQDEVRRLGDQMLLLMTQWAASNNQRKDLIEEYGRLGRMVGSLERYIARYEEVQTLPMNWWKFVLGKLNMWALGQEYSAIRFTSADTLIRVEGFQQMVVGKTEKMLVTVESEKIQYDGRLFQLEGQNGEKYWYVYGQSLTPGSQPEYTPVGVLVPYLSNAQLERLEQDVRAAQDKGEMSFGLAQGVINQYEKIYIPHVQKEFGAKLVSQEAGPTLGSQQQKPPSTWYQWDLDPALQRINPEYYSIDKGVEGELGDGEETYYTSALPDMERLMALLGAKLYGDPAEMGTVTIKEFLQNSFDAIKPMLADGRLSEGKIDITLNEETRQITFSDNGHGMSKETLGGAFVSLAGSKKEGKRASGSLGLAKGLILYGNKDLEVETTRDGVTSSMKTTGLALLQASQGGPKVSIVAKRTGKPAGTKVTVTLPKTYFNTESATDEEVDFPSTTWIVVSPLANSPLFDNIEVTYNGEKVLIGKHFPYNEYSQLFTVQFNWGIARVYVEKKEGNYPKYSNLVMLSNGIYQFPATLLEDPTNPWGTPLKRQFYADIVPNTTGEHASYPFQMDRQSFTAHAQKDMNTLILYLNQLYRKSELVTMGKKYSAVSYLTPAGDVEPSISLTPPVPKETLNTLFEATINDSVEVRDGELIVNNRPVPMHTKEQLKAIKTDLAQFRVDPSLLKPNQVIYHDNLLVEPGISLGEPKGLVPLSQEMEGLFGKKFFKAMNDLGEFGLTMREHLANTEQGASAEEYRGFSVGIGFDPAWYGLNTTIPLRVIFVNPAAKIDNGIDGVTETLWITLWHELAHVPQRNHGAKFQSQLEDFLVAGAVNPKLVQLKKDIREWVRANWAILEVLHEYLVSPNSKPATDALAENVQKGTGLSARRLDIIGNRARRRAELLRRALGSEGGLEEFSDIGRVSDPSEEGDGADPANAGDAVKALGVTDDVPELPTYFKRMQGFFHGSLQLLQTAKLLPNLKPLQYYRRLMQSMSNMKNQLMSGPNQRIKEWYNLSKEDSRGVMQMIKKEVSGGTHWTELERVPVVLNGQPGTIWLHKATQRVHDEAKALGLSNAAVQVYMGVKNDFLTTLGEMEMVAHRSVQDFFAKNPISAAIRVGAINAEFKKLRETPYFPDRRFGKWSNVVRTKKEMVVDGKTIKAGETVFFSGHRRKGARNREYKELVAKYGSDYAVTTTYVEDEPYVMRSMPRELLRALPEKLSLTPDQIDLWEQLYYDVTREGSYIKMLGMEKKSTAGAEQDLRMSYADYMWRTSNLISKMAYSRPLSRELNKIKTMVKTIKNVGGNSEPLERLHEYLTKNYDYVMRPQREYEALRAWTSLWYLWGAPKTALMNLSTLATTSYPYLAARSNDLIATKEIIRAMKDVVAYWKTGKSDVETATVLAQGLKDGVINQSFAAELAAVQDGNAIERLLPTFSMMKDSGLRDTTRKALWKTMHWGMLPFRVAEGFNRQVTMLAMYRIARAQESEGILSGKKGDGSAYQIARDAVDFTQNEYAPWNRAPFLWGKKSVFLIFYSFVQHMAFFMLGGDKGWLRSWLILAFLAGMQGLPGVENVIDVLNWLGRKFLGETDLRRSAREFAQGVGVNPDYVMHGVSHSMFGLGWDVSASMSLGRIIPGTDAIFGQGSFDQRLAQAAGEIGGPFFSLSLGIMQALTSDNPNMLLRLDKALPPFFRNLERTANAMQHGEWQSGTGKTLVDEVTGVELLGQAMGFAPTSKTEAQERNYFQQQAAQYYVLRRTNLMAMLFEAIEAKDTDAIADSREAIAKYNLDVPDRQLKITPQDIRASLNARKRTEKAVETGMAATRRYRPLYERVGSTFAE